jgi:integrase
MASVIKPTGHKRYLIWYVDETGRRRKATGCSDKAESERIARHLEDQVALRKAGLIDRKAEAYRDYDANPLAKHLDEFKATLLAKGNTARHATVTVTRARRILDLGRMKWISDLSLSRAMEALQSLRSQGRSQETLNHYVRAVKAFSRWLKRDGRAREHYLEYLATKSPESDRRRNRRALTPDEASALVAATESGPIVMDMTGHDRAILYAMAIGTGLRSKELRTLTPERFNLKSDPPTVKVLGAYSKNRREAIQPIPRALADRIRSWLAQKPRGTPVFGRMTKRTAEMLAIDLRAAGVPVETDAGIADFHALRGTYVSHLVASGVSVKTCQELARHSTPSLTIGVYAKALGRDISDAIDALPDICPSRERYPANVDGTQSLVGSEVSSIPTDALKSSPGEPGCGFESHRRYSGNHHRMSCRRGRRTCTIDTAGPMTYTNCAVNHPSIHGGCPNEA